MNDFFPVMRYIPDEIYIKSINSFQHITKHSFTVSYQMFRYLRSFLDLKELIKANINNPIGKSLILKLEDDDGIIADYLRAN